MTKQQLTKFRELLIVTPEYKVLKQEIHPMQLSNSDITKLLNSNYIRRYDNSTEKLKSEATLTLSFGDIEATSFDSLIDAFKNELQDSLIRNGISKEQVQKYSFELYYGDCCVDFLVEETDEKYTKRQSNAEKENKILKFGEFMIEYYNSTFKDEIELENNKLLLDALQEQKNIENRIQELKSKLGK